MATLINGRFFGSTVLVVVRSNSPDSLLPTPFLSSIMRRTGLKRRNISMAFHNESLEWPHDIQQRLSEVLKDMKRFSYPLAIGGVFLAAYAILHFMHRPLAGEETLRYILAAGFVAFSVAVARAINFLVFDIIFQQRKGRQAPALLRVLLSIMVYSTLSALIFSLVLNRSLAGILTTSAVVSVIIGLALQETLGNFFAGISIHIEQPFHIGDTIKIEDRMGKVDAVTWRTTAIRTNSNSLLIFPNSVVAQKPLEIFRLDDMNRHSLVFPAPYSVPPQRVVSLVNRLVRKIPHVASERPSIARIVEFADSSVNYELLYWVKDYMRVPGLDARLRESIWYLFKRSNIDIPFPTRHVLVEQQETRRKSQEVNYGRVLDKVDIFDPLSPQEKELITSSMVRFVYAPGEIILQLGDEGDSMFVIRRGKAEVRLPKTNGDYQQIAVLGPGDFFGEMALFTGEARSADVVALEELVIFEIRKSCMELLFAENSDLVEAFSLKVAQRQAKLSKHSQAEAEESVPILQESILQRIKRFFCLNAQPESPVL
jgi:small-conductance mechanosensitive channel/CRP-like cAMP-binding protein